MNRSIPVHSSPEMTWKKFRIQRLSWLTTQIVTATAAATPLW
jgi:hypothetical protein